MSINKVRVPLRASIIGGGTDLPEFMWSGGYGRVLSVSLPFYIYSVHNQTRFDASTQYTPDFDIATPLTIAVMDAVEARGDRVVPSKLSFYTDVPAKGTGLGSSAAWIRALSDSLTVNGLSAYESFDIERSMGSSCGYQDHFAAYHNGFNFHAWRPCDSGHPAHDMSGLGTNSWLLKCIHIYYLGGSRDSNTILHSQSGNVIKQIPELKKLALLADMGYTAAHSTFEVGQRILSSALKEAWEIKKSFAPGVSNPKIDEAYEAGLKAGAWGGKVMGAGGAGFIMFIADGGVATKTYLNKAMEELGLPVLINGIDSIGFYSKENIL